MKLNYVKNLYKILANYFNMKFTRQPQSKPNLVNELIDSQNYYAYGIAAGSLWVLEYHILSLFYMETIDGGALVFDVVDIIKDAFLLPIVLRSDYNNIEKEKHKKELMNNSSRYVSVSCILIKNKHTHEFL